MYKNAIAGLLLTIFMVSPLAHVRAESVRESDIKVANPKEQLESLSSTLIKIGNAIATSNSINDTQRLALMKQLLLISTQIIELNKQSRPVSNIPNQVIFDRNSLEESKKDTAKKAGLEKVKVTLDVKKNEAIVETTFKSNSKSSKTTYKFPELNSVTDFDKKMELLRRLASEKVSTNTNVKFNDVEQVVMVTGRNPLKDSLVIANSPVAISLSTNFAQNSIVNSFDVYPGKNSGSIRITTDQNEAVNLILQREVDQNGNTLSTYTSTYEFYFPTVLDALMGGLGKNTSPALKVLEESGSLSENEIKEDIITVFGGIPFSSQVPNFSGKLLAFMTDNNTVYYDSSNNQSQSDCSSLTDKAVVTEYVKFLVDNLDAQYEEPAKIIKFHTPIIQDEFSSGCSSKSKYF
jgi:hypothetical protein